ncbi:MAG: hypothetical protein NTV72_03130 [Candidatus Taylorbacteria bacterium]|nr:hypothetical protein [Candidatus Taylorbacteria bacterium]
MSKRQIIFVLGIIISFIPFSGFTSDTKQNLVIIFGLIVAAVSLTLKKEPRVISDKEAFDSKSGASSFIQSDKSAGSAPKGM